MDRDPQTHRESQSEPNQIAEGLVDGRETFAMRTAHAYRHGHERPNEQRSKSNGRIRTPIGMAAPGIPTFEGPVCCS